MDDDSKLVTLFKPSSTKGGYFSNFGWIKVSSDENFNLPNDQTIWTTNSKKITNNNPAIFSWTNNQGIQFEQEISIDENYMLKIKKKVINNSPTYGRRRTAKKSRILHFFSFLKFFTKAVLP